MSERTRRDYPRPKFEKRVKELTAYKGQSSGTTNLAQIGTSDHVMAKLPVSLISRLL